MTDYTDAELAAAYAEPPPELHKFWLLQCGEITQLIGDNCVGTESGAKQRFVLFYCCNPEEIEVLEYYEKDCYFTELSEEEQKAMYFYDVNT